MKAKKIPGQELCVRHNDGDAYVLSHIRLCAADLMDSKPTRLFYPWNFLGKNTKAVCHFLLQGIFLTQGSNLHLLCLLH